MQSFRTELENPIVEQDIIDLEKKIRLFQEGNIVEDKFKSLRLARGIYGQRQPGVQMVRIKLPYGKMTSRQLVRIADLSDEYATGNLHLTTRQDIQLHYVSLDKTPELWHKLSLDDITIREACGNTVRNITASPTAGIDPEEPFDVSPYAHAAYTYFLRNPVCQEMGRKFKIAFSSSARDTALTYIHDLGFIPKIRDKEGKEQRGFLVVVGGGLGAQPFLAKPAFDFLPVEQFIAYTEAVLRVFDRYGERSSRHKARIKFLIEKIGLDSFTKYVNEEYTALKANQTDLEFIEQEPVLPDQEMQVPPYHILSPEQYQHWLKTNVFNQKQQGYFGAYLKIQTGDVYSDKARILADFVKAFAADDMRITPNQGLLIKFLRQETLPYLYSIAEKLGFASPGFDSTGDITTCPGTDTCNLGISNSTSVTRELERVISTEYPGLVYNRDIKIKISGCMNSCGQHSMASIGFHGSSLKSGSGVLPALQVLLGGGTLGNGQGRIAEKIIKIPSKRAPQVLRILLNDFAVQANPGESFHVYYDRQGKEYFYKMLKPLADLTGLAAEDFIDWGKSEKYSPAIGVGECAGVMIDLVATLINEAEEKWACAEGSLGEQVFADAIYHAYTAFICTAKALLLDQEVACNTQIGILNDFDKHFNAGDFGIAGDLKSMVLEINRNEPGELFAAAYLEQARQFINSAKQWRREIQVPQAILTQG
ncbi:MAG TPA: nitrite/sulfite reductase [Chitinophagaceae bacterium]|nr:nitrite/sulfite reductase [Chitinophagaceae bacterium]